MMTNIDTATCNPKKVVQLKKHLVNNKVICIKHLLKFSPRFSINSKLQIKREIKYFLQFIAILILDLNILVKNLKRDILNYFIDD